ncbi:hypothetical protein U0070_005417 [Myodes glareolus]|uniref:G-protein coupled receptors family 1 profile domain-containing protein n=1 Tax=Myodes glareolus TaxID=447135 RepID=A0AAW0HCE8_MYOGA
MALMKNGTGKVTLFLLLGLTDDPGLQLSLFITFLLIYIITLVGNLGMILLILLDARLHTPMYIFLGNLSLVDFCYSSAVTPTVMTELLVGDKTISYNNCAAQMFFFVGFATAENYLLASMAYDRYVAVCKPLHYTSTMTKSVYTWLIIGSYVISFMTASIHIADIFTLSFFIWTSYMFIFVTILKMHSAAGHRKALSTCASHFTAVSIFYGTVIFMYLQPSANHTMDTDQVASVFYTTVIPMINPLVYSLRNKEVKNAFLKSILHS